MRLINRIIPGEYRYPTITPFTIPDGHTYLKTLEWLIQRMKQIIDEIDENNVELLDIVIDTLNSKIDEINTAFTEFEGDVDDKLASVDTKISDLESFVNTEINGLETFVTTEINSLETHVNDSVQQIINSSVEVQDPVVADIVGDTTSLTSKTLVAREFDRRSEINALDYAENGVITAQSIQNAIDEAASIIINSQMGVGATVFIPSGTVAIDQTIHHPPHVHVYTNGSLILQSEGLDVVWRIYPRSEDPSDISGGKLGKQQWNWAQVMSARGGAFIFKNMGDRLSTTALELGARDDLGAYKPFSRYAMSDVVIDNFHLGVKWNGLRNYICSFYRFQIEAVDIGVQYGDDVNVIDAGEKIVWYDSLFASMPFTHGIAHHVRCDTVGIDFVGCSFDYMHTVIKYGAHTGYQYMNIFGGHIEGVRGLIVDSASTLVQPVVALNSVSCVLRERKEYFSGPMTLSLDMIHRSANTLTTEPVWMVGDGVILKRVNYDKGGSGSVRIAKQVNLLPELSDTLYDVYGNNHTVTFDDGSAFVTITDNGYATFASKPLNCSSGERLVMWASFKRNDPVANVNTAFRFFDQNDEIILTSQSNRLFYGDDDVGSLVDPVNGGFVTVPNGAVTFSARFSVVNTQAGSQLTNLAVYRT